MPRSGFSLIELVVVMLIIGILAGIALPRVINREKEAAIAATISHLKTIALAAEMCFNESGAWPSDANRGVRPPELEAFLRPNLLEQTCPIGGDYDWQNGVLGITAAIAVVDATANRSLWQVIDEQLDDGDLTTGRVYTNVNRLLLVIEP